MNRIEIEFTEEDRQNAEAYGSPIGCLIYTALKRMGFAVRWVGGYSVGMHDGSCYYPDDIRDGLGFSDSMASEYLCADEDALAAPFYLASVIGRKVVLIRDDETTS